MKSLVVGQAGRESILGEFMAQHSALHVVMEHANPSLVHSAERSGGAWQLGGTCDPDSVAAFATQHGVEIAMVSADDPLAAGVVDALQAKGIAVVGPTRAGAKIEWDKLYARSVLDQVAPQANPKTASAATREEVEAALAEFDGEPIAVKPVGLTGGKGVKVMGPHLATYAEASEYAAEILAGEVRGGSVLFEEKLTGLEFTIQAITDGQTIVFPPATYDYPYRCDGDTGPGTGGMGSFTDVDGLLPGLSREDYAAACAIVEAVIRHLDAEGRSFSGVLNAGFMATEQGVKVIEFNARFGDPECLNILSLFDGNWIETMQAICERRLTPDLVPLRDEATVVVYLVSPEYAFGGGSPTKYRLDTTAAREAGCRTLFHSSVEVGEGEYQTLGTSRAVGLTATGSTREEARDRVVEGIERSLSGTLEWRQDIASPSYIEAFMDPAGRASRAARSTA
ncbi:MAG TPA: phosphoribosylamine--glycine ligase [Solirubrobacterales bacterium]|nr:phosphoribosylamine--glycine ligase [Solirubrobacterales bacterium]